MDPQAQFCRNPQCPTRGQTAQGNIKVHSYRERRDRCTTCKKTFAASTGTPFYRLHKDPSLFVCVVTLLAYGCPTQAVVAAFGLDERTVADWQDKAGGHAQRVHRHFLGTSPFDLQHVQADEISGKTAGGRCWLAMAIAVPDRLWLGGVVSPIRDRHLIQRVIDLVRLAWTPGRTLLICVDGLASYVTACWHAFREKVDTGRRGRPPYRLPRGLLPGQVVKRHSGRRLVEVIRRGVWGSLGRINRRLKRTGTGRQSHTSYIERLNATFRSRLASVVRRGRGLAHQVKALELGMDLVGCVYNFCTEHRSLRLPVSSGQTRWQGRTPAMAAGWTDHVWSVRELLSFRPPTLVGAGMLGRGEVEAELLDAALAAGLPGREALGTIRSGLEAGLLEPRSRGFEGG
jgi:transposase-like protein/transposase